MNTKIAIVVGLLLLGAGGLVAAALLAKTTPEFSVGRITSGSWPPADTPADVVRSQEIKLSGFCVGYDPAKDPYLLYLAEVNPDERPEGAPPQKAVAVRMTGTVPEGLSLRSKVYATGYYDPATGVLTAHTVTATCPSTEQVKFEQAEQSGAVPDVPDPEPIYEPTDGNGSGAGNADPGADADADEGDGADTGAEP